MVDLLLFLEVVIFCREETFEVLPRFVENCLFAPFFAGLVVVSGSADGVIGGLEDLVWGEGYLAVCCILYAVVDFLEVDIDRLGGVEGIVHSSFAVFDVGGSNFAVAIEKVIEEVTGGDAQVSGVFVS